MLAVVTPFHYSLQPRPKLGPVPFQHPHFTIPMLACFKKPFAVMVVYVLIFTEYEARERLPGEIASLFAQQGSSGEIGLQDQSPSIEGDISHRGKIVKVKI